MVGRSFFLDRFFHRALSPPLSEAKIEEFEGGKRIVIPMHAPDPESDEPDKTIFEGTETITLLPEGSVRFQIELTMLTDTPAILEWQTAAINTNPLIGRPYEAIAGTETVKGEFPVEAPGNTPETCTYANGIRKMTLHSRIGPIVIESDEETGLHLFDYRKNRWADRKKPSFWLGRTSRPLKRGETIHYDVTFRFSSDRGGETIPLQRKTLEPVSIAEARKADLESPPAIIPNRNGRNSRARGCRWKTLRQSIWAKNLQPKPGTPPPFWKRTFGRFLA
jgi:hypothetical protein